jgi:hypothetical protein
LSDPLIPLGCRGSGSFLAGSGGEVNRLALSLSNGYNSQLNPIKLKNEEEPMFREEIEALEILKSKLDELRGYL